MDTRSAPQCATTCPYCGVGCGVIAQPSAAADTLIAVSGDTSHPANAGRLCVKGTALHETLGEHGRLLHAEINGKQVDLDVALQHVADNFLRIRREHGPGSVAFYLSGQLLTEDYYVANKLMKGYLGSANVDTNSRLCMSSAVAAYKRAFGEDVVPCDYADLDQADLLVLVGSNAAWTHPVLYQRMVAAKEARPEMKVVVIDPRRSATCDIADLHLAPAPGSDAYLFNGLLNYLVKHRQIDFDWVHAHTQGLDETLAEADGCSLQAVSAKTGLSAELLETFYALFARTRRTVSFYSQGVNQSATGTDKCNAIINCHLLTGRIGRPGMGPFSITGQPNAMGGREVGGLANQLAAHMGFEPESVDRVGRFWSAPDMATAPGLNAVDMFDAIGRGEIRAVWIMATNPVVSLPDADRVREALRACELVVVSDCVRHTDTTACADVLLPAAAWGEKDGTVTNSERCISRQRAVLKTPGDARPDWWLVATVARKMGFEDGFNHASPSEIFAEHAALSAFENQGRRLFDIGALSTMDRDAYDAMRPTQWPLQRRPFADGRFSTPSGRACFVPVKASLPLRKGKDRQRALLMTGRVRDQWHTMTRTARARRLLTHVEMPFVAMSAAACEKLGVRAGDLCQVANERGSVVLEAVVDDSLADDTLFAPIHWSNNYASAARIGSLVAAVTDPVSGQPESKFVPVDVRPQPTCRWISVISRAPLAIDNVDYWVRMPAGSAEQYLIACFDGSEMLPAELLQQWAPDGNLIELQGASPDEFSALVVANGRIELAMYCSESRSDLPATSFLPQLLARQPGADSWRLLAGRDAGDGGCGRMVCSCFEVGEQQIVQAIADGADSVQALAAQLRCGSNCGSCIPELKQLVQQHAPSVTDAAA